MTDEKITAGEAGDEVRAAMGNFLNRPLNKFSVGQEVNLPNGQTGKILEVRGTFESGFSYSVAHGIHSNFAEGELSCP